MASLGRHVTFASVLRVFNLAATVVVSLALMPLCVRILGDHTYGIWSLVAVFTSYYGLMDLGLSSAVSRFLARAIGANDAAGSRRVFTAAARVYLVAAAVACLAGVILGANATALGVTPADAPIFHRVIMIASATVALGFPARLFLGVLNANLRFDITACLELLTLALRSSGVAWAVLHGYGIVGLASATLFGSVPSIAISMWMAIRYVGGLSVLRTQSPWAQVKELFSYSSFSFISQIAELLRFQLDALVVAAFLGAAAVTHYRVAGTIGQYFIELVSAVMSVVPTLFSRYDGRRDFDAIRRLFFFGTRISMCATGFVGFGLLAWGRPFIVRWMGPAYLDAYPPMAALVIGCICALAQSPSVGLLFGLSRHRVYAGLNMAEGLANLGLSVVLAKRYGLLGVALGTMIPMMISKLLVQPIYACHVAGVKWRAYARACARTAAAIGVALVVPGFVTALAAGPSYGRLMFVGSVSMACYAVVVWRLVFDARDRSEMRAVVFRNTDRQPEPATIR